MKDQSTTCVQLTFLDLLNATGSVGSEAGRTRCGWRAGRMIGLSGPEARPANPSAQPVVRRAATMQDTSPPILSAWSGPPAPQCCLANKSPVRKSSERLQAALESALEARLHGLGSTIYQTAWKPHVTPLGRAISRQRASARRISDSAPSSGLCGWPTARANDGTGDKIPPGREGGLALKQTVLMAGWAQPTAGNASGSQMAKDASATGRRPDGSKATVSLPQVASFAGWPTPRASENVQTNLDEIAETGSSWLGQNRGATVSTMAQMAKGCPARFTASGQMLTGCSAGMESGGQLNPRFSGWLMGYPDAWCRAALSCQLPTRSRKAEKTPVE